MPDGAFIAVSLVGRRSVARMLLGGPATAHPLLGYSGARPKHAPHAPPRFWGLEAVSWCIACSPLHLRPPPSSRGLQERRKPPDLSGRRGLPCGRASLLLRSSAPVRWTGQ